MKHQVARVAACALAGVAGLLLPATARAGASAQGSAPSSTTVARALPAPRQHPKLSPSLDRSRGTNWVRDDSAPSSDGTVRVVVNGSDVSAARDAVEQRRGSVEAVAGDALTASVPSDELGALSDDVRVASVHAPRRFTPTVMSEGVHQTAADTWQAAGQTGSGVKVAVVDLGFTGLPAEQAAGRLPLTVVTQNYCSSGLNGETDHGTGVAEIVHQMAPGAQLYVVCFDSDREDEIGSAVSYLQSQGVTIVNASWGSVGYARGDGSGPSGSAEAAIAQARAAGQLWIFAAGNAGASHYGFNPTDAEGDGFIEMFHTATSYVPGPDGQETYPFQLNSGAYSDITLKWDLWPSTSQEFEMCLWYDTVSNNTFYGCASSLQSQTPGIPNVEGVFQGLPNHSQYFLAIVNVNATALPHMDLYLQGAEFNFVRTVAGSIADPASSPSAFAVGAYNVHSPYEIEPYSGEGPTIDGRIKPDIAGPDVVSNDVYNPFAGTSAAAPHVTGAAGLLKGVDPNLNANLLQAGLQGMSIDREPGGTDNAFGTGTLNLSPKAIGGPSAVTVADQTVTFVRGSDGGLWERNGSGVWSRLGGFLTSDLDVAAMPSGKLDVFGRGADNALWHITSSDGGKTFGSWQSLGGLMASGPGAVSWGEGREDVFVKGVDGALWHRGFSNNAFEAWQSLGGLLSSDPTVSSWGVNRLDVFIRGNDSALWHIVWNGSIWTPWQGLGGVLGSGPGAVSVSFNNIDVFVRGSDGALWSRNWNGAVWSNWFGLGGGLIGDPDPAGTSTQLDVTIDGLDGALYRKSRTNGVWSSGGPLNGWVDLGAPMFSPSS